MDIGAIYCAGGEQLWQDGVQLENETIKNESKQ